ncbi:uncharacterized protein LOC119069658 [Bradysia coprophila]|uniref:uncharacterized protein LOC119069658 n=1 Tax=Bradysia coprophila TaxID=38358 RepID=UPI00187D8CC3|nr:uncharacterized protein LOC119069658 [Bradysia coprophila]
MNDLEAICVRISLATGSLFLYALYIQPTADISIYRSHVAAINAVRRHITSSDTFQVLGDFNLYNVEWHENDDGFDYIPVVGESMCARSIIAREVSSTMSDQGLFQMSSFANVSGNILDLIYTDAPELCVINQAEFRMLPASMSDVDHIPLSCMIECCPIVDPTASDESDSVFCFKKADYDAINAHLSDAVILQDCAPNVNESVTTLYANIYDTFDKFVPRATIRSSSNPKWYTKQLLHLKNVRNKQFKKLSAERKHQLSSGISTVLDDREFLQAKDDYEALRTELHSNFIREKSHCIKTDPKSFWRHINSKRKSNSLPAIVELNGKKATTNAEKSHIFAEYFQSVYVEHPNDPSILDFINARNDNNCHDIASTQELVKFVLSGLDVNKGSGHDGVSSLFLRKCAINLAGPLNIIFNQSLTEKRYPDAFKIGQLTPVYKSGRKTDVTNYRGVNVMPNLAKVFERVVFMQMKLVIPHDIELSQHAFIPGRNIESNLMELSVVAHDAFDQNAQLDTFNVDISKAFDKVAAMKLIRKMAMFPISNSLLLWFISYLTSRVQYVLIGKDRSKTFIVLSGVGQGSILGVFLFLMFFNDSDVRMTGIFCLNFADDKKIASIIKSEKDALNLQAAINLFFKWCSDNGMEINRIKSKIITYTLKTKPIIFDYTLNGQIIQRTNSIFDLGVLTNTRMNFNSHHEYVSNKSKSVLNFVKRQRQFLDDDATKIVYKALVRSNLEFAACIWSPHFATHRRTIESTQKQFVMFLNGDHLNRSDNDYVLSPYVERCAGLDLQTLIRRRTNVCILFIHSLITGKINSPTLRSRITLNSRSTRHNGMIFIRACRTSRSFNSPFNNACRMFNAVSNIIDPTLPHNLFRNALYRLPDSNLTNFLRM